jgi:hypothetical protein
MSQPKLSLVVVVHRMSRQAARSLECLTPAYQRHVDPSDYEVIVVENASDDLLGEEHVRACGENFRYFLREDRGSSPVFSLSYGLWQARSFFVGVLLDGAYLMTPRVLEFALIGRLLAAHPVVAVPGYHLGRLPQHEAHAGGYGEDAERELLERSGWEADPYRLFDVSVPIPGTQAGYLVPLPEAGCFFVHRKALRDLQGQYQLFVEPGGGSVASFLLSECCRRPGAELIVLPGEGAFHQFHGGVYSSHREDREDLLFRRRWRLQQVTAGKPEPVEREPRLLGAMTGRSLARLRVSLRPLTLRARTKAEQGLPLWSEE